MGCLIRPLDVQLCDMFNIIIGLYNSLNIEYVYEFQENCAHSQEASRLVIWSSFRNCIHIDYVVRIPVYFLE